MFELGAWDGQTDRQMNGQITALVNAPNHNMACFYAQSKEMLSFPCVIDSCQYCLKVAAERLVLCIRRCHRRRR